MTNAYRTAPPSSAEIELLCEMARTARYSATSLTSARLASLERRGYVERKPGRTLSARPTWVLTVMGRQEAHRSRQNGSGLASEAAHANVVQNAALPLLSSPVAIAAHCAAPLTEATKPLYERLAALRVEGWQRNLTIRYEIAKLTQEIWREARNGKQ